MHSRLAFVPAVLLGVAAAAQGVAAQDPSSSASASWSQPAGGNSSSIWNSTPAGNATAAASGQANATASNTAAVPVSTSTQNPLIPSSISPKCQSFLTYLNSASSVSQCTTPLLSALSSFQPAPDSGSSYTASPAQVHSALADLCAQPACDDGLVRDMLGSFAANCTAELEAKNQVVLGSYDALYVLEPLREAVCTTDSAGAFCVEDIAAGKVPSTPSNATTATATVALNTTASAAAPVNLTALASSASSASAAASSASSTAQAGSQLAAQTYTIPVPAPQALYVQITKVAKRWYGLAKRQYQGSSGSSWSTAASSASVSAAAASSSSAGASNSTSAADASSNSSASATPLALPSLLPNSATWSSLSLPFLFLTPSMPSSTLCTPCTRTILASYIAFESRMPYALGLANSPLLGGQGQLWEGIGEKCGSGFLETVAKEAGEANLTGAAGALKATRSETVVAAVLGAAALLAVAL